MTIKMLKDKNTKKKKKQHKTLQPHNSAKLTATKTKIKKL